MNNISSQSQTLENQIERYNGAEKKNYGKLPNNFASKKYMKKQKAKKPDDRATINFPEKILDEILSRLPVRSFVRFKCVSKFCITLISDPYFIRNHLNHAKNDEDYQKLLFNQCCPKDNRYSIYCCPLSPVQLVEDVEKLKLDCPLIPKPRCCIIHCCYDGLAVIHVCDNDCVIFLLWNPSIRESIVLPILGYPQDGMFSHFGLGYDSINDEYKILHMLGNQGNSKYPNEILVLKSSLWRRIDEHPLGNSYMQYLPFIRAAFHWISISRNYFVVVSFSISNEVYREISLSQEILSLRPGSDGIGLSPLEGMLCVHSNSVFMGKTTFKVWILKEYGVKGSWMPLFTIIKDSCLFNASPKYRFADGEVLFWCIDFESRGHTFRTVNRPFKSWPRCDTIQSGHAFTESLISLKSLTY